MGIGWVVVRACVHACMDVPASDERSFLPSFFPSSRGRRSESGTHTDTHWLKFDCSPEPGADRAVLAIGLFGTHVVNSIGLDGLFYGGGTALLGKQALGVGMVALYSFLVTLVLGFIIEKTIGFRLPKDAEVEGVDLSEHAETAYEMSSSSRGGSF